MAVVIQTMVQAEITRMAEDGEADEIESIRAYWKYVVDKDETTLKALKSSVKENDANGQH